MGSAQSFVNGQKGSEEGGQLGETIMKVFSIAFYCLLLPSTQGIQKSSEI
jgi:hypothetical protein